MATQATLIQVQEIYIGLLGRAADLEGLNYWAGEISDGKITIEQVRANIVNEQAEYAANLGAISSRAILVATLYQNMFNRAPDSEGLEYWVNGGGKEVNADQLVLALSNGASAVDRLALDNRADVANSFTTNATFTVSGAAAVLLNVDSTLTSVATAKASISSDAESPAAAGQTFTLTTDADDLKGTSANDTFTGAVGTLTTDDLIDGGAGTDTLVARIKAAQTPVLTSVENIEVEFRNAAADMVLTDADGVEKVTVGGTTAGAVTDLDIATKLVVKNYDDTVTVTIADAGEDDDTLNLTVDGADAATVDVVVGSLVENLNLVAEGAASELTYDDNAGALETVTVTGAADVDVTFTGTDATFETFNASAATGDVTMTVSTASKLTVTGGEGDDTFEFGTTFTGADKIDGGAGADTLTATINSTGTLRAEISAVETLDVNFTAAGVLDLRDTTGVTTLDLSGSSAVMDVNNAQATLVSAVFTADSDQDVGIDYASGVTGALTITIGDADEGDGVGVDIGDLSSNATTLTINAVGDDANTVDTILNNTATTISITTSTEDGTLGTGNLTLDKVTTLTLSAVAGDLTVGTLVDADTLTTLNLTATGAASLTLGDVGSLVDPGDDAAFALATIEATVATGDLTLGAFDVATDDDDGVALTRVAITSAGESIQLGAGATFIDGNSLDEDANLDSFTLTSTGDDVNLDVGDVAVAELDELTLSVTGEDGNALFDLFTATDMGDVAITVGEDTVFTITKIAANEVGDITISAAADSDVTLDDLDISGDIGRITLSGDGEFDIDITDADSVGEINAEETGEDAIVNIDLTGVEADASVVLGESTNTVSVSAHDDEITLADDAGTDTIFQNATTAGSITIDNFEAGAGGDVIELSKGGMNAGGGTIILVDSDAEGANVADDIVFATLTGALDLDTISADNNVLVLDGDITSETDLLTQLAIGGDFALTLGAELGDDDAFLVLWDDGEESYLSAVINTSGVAIADGDTLTTGELSVVTFITLVGVTDATDVTTANLGGSLNA